MAYSFPSKWKVFSTLLAKYLPKSGNPELAHGYQRRRTPKSSNSKCNPDKARVCLRIMDLVEHRRTKRSDSWAWSISTPRIPLPVGELTGSRRTTGNSTSALSSWYMASPRIRNFIHIYSFRGLLIEQSFPPKLCKVLRRGICLNATFCEEHRKSHQSNNLGGIELFPIRGILALHVHPL